jgi:hypothetical protein
MTPEQEAFDRYYESLPPDESTRFKGVLNLDASSVKELSKAFVDIRAEINARLKVNARQIIGPDGAVQLCMEYVESTELNAMAFFFEGIYFIGITEGMLKLFSNSCTALWRLEPLADLLEIRFNPERRNSLFQIVLLLQLQFISNHELGHMFHGHCGDLRSGRFQAEFGIGVKELVANSLGIEGQARELEADGYAVNLLLSNLLDGPSGDAILEKLQPGLEKEDFLLTLFVLAIGTLLYFLEPKPFDPSLVRADTHSQGVIRMNIILGEIIGWCNLNRMELTEWVSLERLQWILACVQVAAESPEQQAIWREQGTFLQTNEGRAYLNEIYERREHLRKKMDPLHWRLVSEIAPGPSSASNNG